MAISSDLVKQALEVIEQGDGQAALDLLKQWLSSAAGEDTTPDPDPDAPDANGGQGDMAEGIAPPKTIKSESVESPKVRATSMLTASQRKICKEVGCSERDFLAARAAITGKQ